MNEPTRPVTLQDSTEHQKTGIFERLKRLLSSESNENESVRDVIEELIEERIESVTNLRNIDSNSAATFALISLASSLVLVSFAFKLDKP